MALNTGVLAHREQTPRVSGFVGGGKTPGLSDRCPSMKCDRITDQMEEGVEALRASQRYEEGETVRVIDGPFANFNGTVDEVNLDKG